MAFKKITLEEWKALGLPVEISTIEFNNDFFKKEKNLIRSVLWKILYAQNVDQIMKVIDYY